MGNIIGAGMKRFLCANRGVGFKPAERHIDRKTGAPSGRKRPLLCRLAHPEPWSMNSLSDLTFCHRMRRQGAFRQFDAMDSPVLLISILLCLTLNSFNFFQRKADGPPYSHRPKTPFLPPAP